MGRDKATTSWTIAIQRERGNVEDILDENPGLKPKRREIFIKAYGSARRDAATETMLPPSVFPMGPPFGVDQVEDPNYWPPGVEP